jgi:hypothetical protein
MTIAQLNTLYTEAVAAIDSGDYTTAIKKLMACKVRLATTPNLTRGLGGGGSTGMSWNPAQLESLIEDCRKLKAAALVNSTSGPIQATKVTYTRVDSDDS